MFIVRQCVCVGYGVYKTIILKKFDNYQDAINYIDDVPNAHVINIGVLHTSKKKGTS